MANLAATLGTLELEKTRKKTPKRIQCYKTPKELQLKASASNSFYLVKFPVRKIALSASAKQDGDAIVLDINVDQIGKTFSGFVPKLYIKRGHNLVENLKANEEIFCNVWLGDKAIKKLSIQADDAISLNDLQEKLRVLLAKQFPSNSSGQLDCTPGSYAWIRDVYPFENYFVFTRNANLYKQAYVVDVVSRDVALAGKPVRVYEEYSEVPKGTTSTAGTKAKTAEALISAEVGMPIMPNAGTINYVRTMSQSMTYDKVNNPDVGTLGTRPGSGVITPETFVTFGAPTSELNNPPIRTMTNVEDALRMYLYDIAEGTHRPVGQQPPVGMANGLQASEYVNAVREANIVANEAKKKINVHDFIKWQTLQLSKATSQKTKFGKTFAFYGSGDREDPSTWHDEKEIKASGKFSIGSKVRTRMGNGTVSAILSKGIHEVAHKNGKKARFSIQEIEAR